jgi:DNA-binding GntR family transcriptional regulator
MQTVEKLPPDLRAVAGNPVGGHLPRQTTAEAVARQLRSEITGGLLVPGERLLQNAVANRLGVSTTPVREAFAMLQADHLVRIDAHRGAVVSNLSVEELVELYSIRMWLEEKAVALAVANMTDDVVKLLEQSLDDMRLGGAGERQSGPHRDFHRLIYEQAGLPRLSAIIDGLRDASGPYQSAFGPFRPASKVTSKDHTELMAACKRRDVATAVRVTRQHLQRTVDAAAVQVSSREIRIEPVRASRARSRQPVVKARPRKRRTQA